MLPEPRSLGPINTSPSLNIENMGGPDHPNCGAKRIAKIAPPIISTSKTMDVYCQYGLKIIPKPAAMSRKGQMCVSAQRLPAGIFPDLTSIQITPAAINNNGPNKDRLCSIV